MLYCWNAQGYMPLAGYFTGHTYLQQQMLCTEKRLLEWAAVAGQMLARGPCSVNFCAWHILKHAFVI